MADEAVKNCNTKPQGESFKSDACSDLSEGSIRTDDEIRFKK